MVRSGMRQSNTASPSTFGWIGFLALTLGAAACAGASGIVTYRTQAIVESPCRKNALGASALETTLAAAGAIFLLVAICAYVAVLINSAQRQTREPAARPAWVGLAVAILLLTPAAFFLAGDPLGFDDQMLPNCVTMAPPVEAVS